jgi:hypothetical protein
MRKIELAKRIAEETGESMEMLGVRPQSVSLQP